MLHRSNEPDPRIMSLLTRFELPLLVVAATVSGAVLAIWLIPDLRTSVPAGWLTMSQSTAAAILLLLASLALTAEGSTAPARVAGMAATIAVLIFGATLFVSDLFGSSLVGDMRLPSTQTALSLAIAGLASVLARRRIAPIAADLALVILWAHLLFMLGGHIFQEASLVGTIDGRSISPQTLFCMFIVGLIVTTRRALFGGWFSVFVTGGMGSRIIRMVLPIVIVAPFAVFTFVALLYESGTLPANFTRAVTAPVVVLAAMSIVGWMGLHINRLERSLRLQSVTDQMTQIRNRRGYEAVAEYVVSTARRSGSSIVVFFFDLDGLKAINDTLGHRVGNQAIKTFANLLRSTFGDDDVVARVGGDEFVVLVIGDQEFANDQYARLQDRVQRENTEGGHAFSLSYSAGFSVLHPESDLSLDDAMARADGFMYEQKRLKETRRTGHQRWAASGIAPTAQATMTDSSI